MSRLEIALTQELAEVELRIKELQDEASALRRQIGKASVKRQGLEFATRKNSMNRLLVENSVLETLRRLGKPTRTAILYKNAKVTNPSLKENTFRTYLHRMKKKGRSKQHARLGNGSSLIQVSKRPTHSISVSYIIALAWSA